MAPTDNIPREDAICPKCGGKMGYVQIISTPAQGEVIRNLIGYYCTKAECERVGLLTRAVKLKE